MPVELEFGCLGLPDKPPLVVLHGLLGSSRNWLGIGKELSEHFNVFLVDLRNHGQSPHDNDVSYKAMCEDLEAWVDSKNIEKFFILGHSMGGKVAMLYAMRHPNKLHGLIVEDIAPREYSLRYQEDFEAMNKLDLNAVKSRRDADELLQGGIPEWTWRQFIMTNLQRDPISKKFYWQINLAGLTESLPKIMLNPLTSEDVYSGPTLFLKGSHSDYIKNGDAEVIKQHFPNSELKTVSNSGHNIHIDNKDATIDEINTFAKGVVF